ncbi:MAG: pilus assembly protein [Rhodomicrobium sp.]|nr:pilus assembly protein [Rhodomicrobium sp.]
MGDAMVFLRALLSLSLFLAIGVQSAPLAGDRVVVDVTIDEARLIRLDGDAAQIIVGNPAIADVAVQSPRLLVVTGKSYGATNLIVLDDAGRETYGARLAVGEGGTRQVTVYRGTSRQSLHCAPECQRMLSLGDDKAQFEQLADLLTKKFGVVNSAIGGSP